MHSNGHAHIYITRRSRRALYPAMRLPRGRFRRFHHVCPTRALDFTAFCPLGAPFSIPCLSHSIRIRRCPIEGHPYQSVVRLERSEVKNSTLGWCRALSHSTEFQACTREERADVREIIRIRQHVEFAPKPLCSGQARHLWGPIVDEQSTVFGKGSPETIQPLGYFVYAF